jgi:ankyrin repeat protein
MSKKPISIEEANYLYDIAMNRGYFTAKEINAISASHKAVLEEHSIDSEPDTDNNCDKFVMNLPIGIIRVVLNRGLVSNVNSIETQMMGSHYTILNYRIGHINVNQTKYLLDLGADPNIKSRHGETALHLALFFEDNPEKVALLLRYGANKEIKNYSGQTALNYAIKYNRTECIKILG